MTHPRRSVDLSGHPGLTVIYGGFRIRNLNGIRSLSRIGRGLRRLRSDPLDGLLARKDPWFWSRIPAGSFGSARQRTGN